MVQIQISEHLDSVARMLDVAGWLSCEEVALERGEAAAASAKGPSGLVGEGLDENV